MTCFSACSKAYIAGKKERPPFAAQVVEEAPSEEKNIPGELLCPLCKDIAMDAVVIPCCGNSFCDECRLRHLFFCPTNP